MIDQKIINLPRDAADYMVSFFPRASPAHYAQDIGLVRRRQIDNAAIMEIAATGIEPGFVDAFYFRWQSSLYLSVIKRGRIRHER